MCHIETTWNIELFRGHTSHAVFARIPNIMNEIPTYILHTKPDTNHKRQASKSGHETEQPRSLKIKLYCSAQAPPPPHTMLTETIAKQDRLFAVAHRRCRWLVHRQYSRLGRFRNGRRPRTENTAHLASALKHWLELILIA